MKTLYTGGPILSLDSAGTAQALLVEDGRIRAVGPLDDVAPLAQNAKKVSLEGRTLLPAFVDGHSRWGCASCPGAAAWRRLGGG